MTSVLSLVVLLSVSACLGLPLIDEQSSTGFPSFDSVTREMEIGHFSSEQTPWSGRDSMTTDLPVSKSSSWPVTSSATIEEDFTTEQPKSSTRKMVPSTTKKYFGHLEDPTEKPVTKKVWKKLSTSTPKVEEAESSEEHSKESEGRKALYDPKALESVSTLATNQMQFDENKESIPELPKESTTKKSLTSRRPKPTEEHEEEESRPAKKLKPLNQGEEPTVTEEEEPNH